MTRMSSDAAEEPKKSEGSLGGEDQAVTSTFSTFTSKMKASFEESALYKMCYITGVQLMRKAKRTRRAVLRFARTHKPEIHLQERHERILGNLSVQLAQAKKPFDEGFAWSVEYAERYRTAVAEGNRGRFVAQSLRSCLRHCSDTSSRIFNYAAPLAGVMVLLLTIGVYSNLTIALSVEYGGDFIGYVESESDFDIADQKMRERIVFEEYVHPDDAIPKFTLKVVGKAELATEEELTDRMISSSGSELTEAYGLYIADKFVGASKNEASIESMLSGIKDEYRTGDPDEVVEFTKEVEIKDGLYPVTSIVNIAKLEEEVGKNESEQRVYTVQKGDAPTLIAQKYDMLYADLKALNPGIEESLLVGQEVLIERSVPMLGVQVTRTEVYNEEVPFKVEHKQDTNLNQGYTKVTQVGQKGLNEITAQVTYVDGVEQERKIIDTAVLREPVNEVMVVGGKKPLKQLPAAAMTTDSYFIWPVDGGYVSCGFYGYYNHGGMDIAGRRGMAVRAAASGTVVTAVPYTANAYGQYVVIDHGGGVQTLYAHNSQLHVQVGQWVEQGQLIASMGSTGNSSGNHCHFEVRVNGVRRDPSGYIGNVFNR